VRIKEEDKWKEVFSMLEDAYELIVMFFGLTNSLVTFSAMMNDLSRNMIETEDVAVFINDIIVETETKKNIVEEVLRRIAENNLFVKPEKYVFKNSDNLYNFHILFLNSHTKPSTDVPSVVATKNRIVTIFRKLHFISFKYLFKVSTIIT